MLKAETGYQTGTAPSITRTTVSVVDTLYTPCGCSPLGKTWKVSLPHAPGGTVYWTEYVYDALGRTIQVKQPNNSGTATYAYAGNTVTSTDAANKWKKFENDALGNLTKVTEPNPAGGANLETTYTYSELAQLLTVSMPRSGVTQTRTFVYNSSTQRLTSTTNPENGTTTNNYKMDGTLDYKIDANGNKISYDYDSLMRVTAVHRFPNGTTEDTTQQTTFEYDANSVAPGFSQNVSGRLAVSKSFAATVTGGVSVTSTFYEMYSYDSAGRILKKRLRIVNPLLGSVDKDIEYNFTAAKLNTVKYPDVNVPFTYYYDNMLRPNRMTGKDPNDFYDGTNVVDYVNSVNYNVASRMTSMWAINIGTSTYTYNERFELTRQQTGSLADIQYEYSATADNGQILSRTNNIAAEKVAYQYDSLKRLISASATKTSDNTTTWASTYGFDGWGNLLSKGPTAGYAPSLNVTVNGLTNRINSGGYSYDNNGNMTSSGTFDVDNRLTTASGESYGYLTNNQRVYKRDASGSEWIYFHDANGKRAVTFQMVNANGTLRLDYTSRNVYFSGKAIILNDVSIVTDRLGSVVSRGSTAVDYFPYGEEKTTTANPAEKFGTYLRDSTGLDYAEQRYYSSAVNRFVGADTSGFNETVEDPSSLNQYNYVQGDPVNFIDPEGTACRDVSLEGWAGIPNGQPVGSFVGQRNNLTALALTIFTESDANAANNASAIDRAAIAAVIMNRFILVNGDYDVLTGSPNGRQGGGPIRLSDWGVDDGNVTSIVFAAGQFEPWLGPWTLTGAAQGRLNTALNSPDGSTTCRALLQSIGTAAGFWNQSSSGGNLYATNGVGGNVLFFTGFSAAARGNEATKASYETWIGPQGSANIFSGVYEYQIVKRGSIAPWLAPSPLPGRPGGGGGGGGGRRLRRIPSE